MSNMVDKVEKIGNILIQHGKQNDRIYIIKIDENVDNAKKIIKDVDSLARKNEYSKIFAKVPKCLVKKFVENDYVIEAEIPKFFNNSEKCFFIAKFLDENRSIDNSSRLNREVLKVAKSKKKHKDLDLPSNYKIKKCNKEDIENICKLYSEVFETYPFPIFDPKYIKQTMNDNLIYFGILEDEKLIAVSSIELDMGNRNAEMTDFSTHPDYRGQNLSLYLLNRMEEELKKLNIPIAHTIARAGSFPMNSTFSKLDYSYAGTLINNTNIGGQIESMNIWYKNIGI